MTTKLDSIKAIQSGSNLKSGIEDTIARQLVRIVPLAFALLLFYGSGLSARAGSGAPFSAELIAVFVGPDREAGLFALEGSATQMGPVAGLARHEVRGFKEFGEFYLEDSSGNVLRCTYHIDADPVLAVGTFEIVGGTGRFANATGGGELIVDETHTPGEPFPVQMVGAISF